MAHNVKGFFAVLINLVGLSFLVFGLATTHWAEGRIVSKNLLLLVWNCGLWRVCSDSGDCVDVEDSGFIYVGAKVRALIILAAIFAFIALVSACVQLIANFTTIALRLMTLLLGMLSGICTVIGVVFFATTFFKSGDFSYFWTLSYSLKLTIAGGCLAAASAVAFCLVTKNRQNVSNSPETQQSSHDIQLENRF